MNICCMIRSHFGTRVAILVQALPVAKVTSFVWFLPMESSTHTYKHTDTHSVPVRGLSECSFFEDLPLGARALNTLALFLMILSLLALALLALRLAASMPKLGSHTCSNLRQTCSDRCLEICKRLQDLIQPSLDEEVAELAKRKLHKLMAGFIKTFMILSAGNLLRIVSRANWISMMRQEAEASEAVALVASLSWNLAYALPSMVFLHFPRTRTDDNVHMWMAMLSMLMMFIIMTSGEDSQARVSALDLVHVIFALQLEGGLCLLAQPRLGTCWGPCPGTRQDRCSRALRSGSRIDNISSTDIRLRGEASDTPCRPAHAAA